MTDQPVDAQRLEQFLEALGRCYRHSGSLYLVGGSSLLLLTAKESTLDVDVQFEVEPAHQNELIGCLRRLSRELSLPVEQAAPEDFIPLPSGYQERRRFVGRFGALEVFHYDLYSTALSKLHRSLEKDIDDVLRMVQAGLIDVGKLEQHLGEILPKMELHSISADPADFQRKFALFKQRLADAT